MSITIRLIFTIFTLLTFVAKAQVPSGFVDQSHSNNWQNPTGLTFDSSGKMYVWEKDGKVYVVDGSVKTLFLDISEEVAIYGDYGILGFALDPNYINNGHVYLFYVVDRHYLLNYGTEGYDSSNPIVKGATIARVTRYTTPTPQTPTTVDYGSRLVLLGETKSTGIPITGTNHAGGGMAFGNDGSLFIGTGDGGLGGEEENYEVQAFEDGIISEAENVEDRVYRCQIINSLNGKILRIDPNNGNGVGGNPFYDSDSPRSAQSRVWALGFRNPFRLSVRPNSGSPGVVYIGEVGWNNREELNIINQGGQNFGWPIYEGNDRPTWWDNPAYIPATYKKPTVEWIHENGFQEDISARVIINDMAHTIGSEEFPGSNFTGTCSIGGVWYTGTAFPEEYRNSYIFADFTPGWIKSFSFDNNQNPTSFRDLNTNALGAVTLAYNPYDQAIYYVKLGFNEGDPQEIRRIYYALGTNVAPTAKFTTSIKNGTSPLNVTFDASASTDPENTGTLTYSWDFGDGQTADGLNPSHTFDNGSSNPQAFKVLLTVTDEGGLTDKDSTIISLNNTPPVIISTSVDAINFFSNNGTDVIALSAEVSDNEEASSQLSYRWTVRMHHDDHSHPALNVTSPTSQVNFEMLPCDGHLYFYRVTLRVTDSYGLSTTSTKDIYPNCGITDTTPPDEPLIKLYNITNNSFNLSWNSVADNIGIKSYEVFINGVSKAIVNAQTLSYQYTSTESIANQSFECFVKAIDLSDNATSSSKISFIANPNSEVNSQVYVSDLMVVSSSNGLGPIEIDKSNGGDGAGDGSALILNGITYAKGLGTHANSEVIYNLTPNQYNIFRAKIGIDDEISDGNCGSVVFKIYKDDNLAYTSSTLYPSSATVGVNLDISNTTQLKLITDISGDNANCDHGDWADAKLLVESIPPTTPSKLTGLATIDNYYQLSWNPSTDDLTTNIIYEIIVNGAIIGSTENLNYTLPTLTAGTYVVSVQAKDEANNRAVSKSLVLTFTPCVSTLNLTTSNNYINFSATLKAADSINATNVISGESKINYQATNKIEFLPGFSVSAGSVFKATIQGCDN
jgi:glucose/arabinose dehydrogenase